MFTEDHRSRKWTCSQLSEEKVLGRTTRKSINYHNGNLSPLPTGHFGGISYRDDGCFNIFAIICDNYGDVWKVHQTNVATPQKMGGGMANLEITLYGFQQITSHIAKHTPLQGVTSGTRTSLTRCDKVHAPLQGAPGDTLTPLTRCDKVHTPLQGVPDGAPTPLTRCDKVHLGQVCCEDTLHLELQSSRSRPRGWK